MKNTFKPEIAWWDINNVIPYALNTKKHPTEQVANLAAQIAEFGWDQPIVVDADGIIIKGHGRRLAAIKLGLLSVPVVVRIDLTEAQKKAARIADNKVAESDWDLDMLKVEIEALGEMNFNLELTGFNELEIGDLWLEEESGPGDDGTKKEFGERQGSTEPQPPETEGDEQPEENEGVGLNPAEYVLFGKEQIIEATFAHFRQHGFPYRTLPYHVCLQELNKLAALKTEKLIRSNLGYQVADTFQPHRFHACADGMKSVLDGFKDDKLLRRAITLELEAGGNITDKHFTSLNFVSGVQVLSNFRPGFALYMYRRFCKPDSVILDTSTGYGGRLVGFLASQCARYIGIDPNVPTYEGNLKLAETFGFSDRVELINLPAEDVPHEQVAGRCDFAFTSPPYFCKEHYSEAKNQSWQRYKTGEAWRDGFLYPLMKLQFAALKPGSYSGMNIADVKIKGKTYPLGQWTVEAGIAAGFNFIEEEKFELSRVMGSKEKEAYEPVFIFQKPEA